MWQFIWARHLCMIKILYFHKNTKWVSNVQPSVVILISVVWLFFVVTAAGHACLHVNLQRQKAPMPFWQLPAPPPPLLVSGSWGLTFHFSDPLFHRANSYAGLEMCCVAAWDKIQGQFQNNLWPWSQGYFWSLPLLPTHFTDLIPIMNINTSRDLVCTLEMFLVVRKLLLWLTNSVIQCISKFLTAAGIKSPIYYISFFHISIRLLYLCSIPNHGNCFLLLLFWVWRDYAWQLQMILFYNWPVIQN